MNWQHELFATYKKLANENVVRAGVFLGLVLCLCFFSVIFLNKTLTSLQIPGVMGGGPYGYTDTFTHRALVDPGGSAWSPRPQTALISKQFLEGTAPLWNPYMGVGQPLAGNMDSNAFNPLRILLDLHPSTRMWDMFYIMRLFLAGIFAYLFLSAIKLSHLSSLFAALLYMLSGYFILSIDMHHVDVEIFLPFMLLCYEKIIQKNNPVKWGVLSSFGVVFLISGGQPQSAFLILSLGFAYFFFRIFSIPEYRKTSAVAKFSLIYIFFSVLGVALSSVLLLPFMEFYGLSANNHDPRGGGGYLGLSYNPYFSDLVSFISPYFMGPIHGSWLEGYSWHILTRGYFGVTAVIFAVIAVLSLRKKSPSDSLIYFFAFALCFMIAKFYGFPLVNWIGELPVAKMVNFGKYMGSLMAFCAAVLAGMGLEKLVNLKSGMAELKTATFVLILLITCTFFYYLRYLLDHSEALSILAKFSPIFGSTVGLVLSQLAIALLFIGGIVWILKFVWRKKEFDGRKLQIYIIAIALVELYIYIPNPGLIKKENVRADIFQKAPYVEFLQKNLNEYRVVGIDRILYPDFGSAFGIGDIRVLDALLPKRYMEFVGNFFVLPSPADRFTGDEGIDFDNKEIRRALNLLGVKYLISNSLLSNNNLIEDILKKGEIVYTPGKPVSQWVNASALSINGSNRKVLFAHAPAKINYPFVVPEKSSLKFSIGMVPDSWAPDKGDGVLFEIHIQDGERSAKIFSEYIDPKKRMEDRKWFDYSIDLSPYAGRKVVLDFVTSPGLNNGQDNGFDWSVWGDIRLESAINGRKLVYDKESKIYENEEVFPRAFVANEYAVITDKVDILKALKDLDFPLRNKVILEEAVPKAVQIQAVDGGNRNSEPKIISYDSQRVELQVEMRRPGFLVLSDLYYPGWVAYVDGKKEKIYQTDYILRSVYLEEGAHTVIFAYEPSTFRLGAWLSGGAALLTLLLLIGNSIYMRNRINS